MALNLRLRSIPRVALTSLAISGCFGAGSEELVKESFSSDNTFSRSFPQPPTEACEAARRALLSQGYIVTSATGDSVQGTKNFQPKDEVHEQLLLRVSCAAHEPDGSWVFVNAVQDRYSLKKSPTSASVGVSVLGSVSLPIGASDDSLVKVASVTVQDPALYNGFFGRLGQYLPPVKTSPKTETKAGPETSPQPPVAAPSASPPAPSPATDPSRENPP